MPVACFVVCLTMCEDTPENRATATGYLDKVREVAPGMQPVDIGLFAGALLTEGQDFERLNPILRGLVTSMSKNNPESAENRDWESIRAWAEGLRMKLVLQPA
jgi:menaquinone-dependent protoporphyrinogen IX oxidase